MVQETQEIQGNQANDVSGFEATAQFGDESVLREDVTQASHVSQVSQEQISPASASSASPKVSVAGDSLIASPSQDFSPSLSTAGMLGKPRVLYEIAGIALHKSRF